MNNLKERATKPLDLPKPKTPSGWVDLLTKKPIYNEEMDECPCCGAKAVISIYPSEETCLKCGYSND